MDFLLEFGLLRALTDLHSPEVPPVDRKQGLSQIDPLIPLTVAGKGHLCRASRAGGAGLVS